MALPSTVRQEPLSPSVYGIAIGITPRDPTFPIELQQAPDNGSGAPNVGAAVTLATLGPTSLSGTTYFDRLPPDGAFRFYRWRHAAAPGYDASPNWTPWARGIPVSLDGQSLQAVTAYPLHRNVALDDALFALRATEVDGSTKKSDAHNPQGSVLPTAVGATGMFSWKSGGLATSQMWISLTWSATTLYRPDGTTVAVPAPPAAPSAPTLSQVAGGTRGATTLFARIAYARSLNGWVTLYPVSAESSLAVGANSLLKITSPGAVAGYDGYVVLVGSATNAEFSQNHNPTGFNTTDIIAFGTDWAEPTGHFATNNTQYDNANWKSVTLIDLAINTTFWMYPYYNLVTGLVELGPFHGSGGDAATAAIQLADRHLPLSTLVSGSYGFSTTTPAGAGTQSGSGGGGRGT